MRGRKFSIRLGTPWDFRDPEHRWDVVLSFVSFMFALAIAGFVFDYLFPHVAGSAAAKQAYLAVNRSRG